MDGSEPKWCRILDERRLLDHVISRVRPQCTSILLNLNDPAHLATDPSNGVATAVVADRMSGYPGPLAGIHAALVAMDELDIAGDWLLSVPCDSPFLPLNLAERLLAGTSSEPGKIVFAADPQRMHPVVALWPRGVKKRLERALEGSNGLSLRRFAETVGYRECRDASWSADHFFNVNTAEDLRHAERMQRS